MKLDSSENSIVEEWEFVNHKMIQNEQGRRIDWLIQNCLIKIAIDKSGWFTLYQDPKDERYWELSFPRGEMHGGGPRLLAAISDSNTLSKYTF